MELAPFTPYMSKPTDGSRQEITRQIMIESGESNQKIIRGFVQIIAMEGPILSNRLFTLYSKKGGFGKLSGKTTRRFYSALKSSIQDGTIKMEWDTEDANTQALLWLPSMGRVVTREYGNRGFDDIPASELGEVIFELATEVGEDKHSIYEALTKLYGLKQLPKNAERRLDPIYATIL